ncbi:MAG TPA: hypothetical protein VNX22_08155, partial [Acidobacteriaceae bacterium]|nr:hypothetical protein [Acidobacteriaceae bacterium]
MRSFAAGKLALILAAGLALAPARSTTPFRAEQKAASKIFFWAWDEPEDMRALAGQHAGVAYLAATMLLDESLHISPRLQPLSVAPDSPLVAVV